MLGEENLRSVEKLCSFRYRESLRISTRTATASVVAATTVLGFNDIRSFIRVHTWADSAELVGSLDRSRVFINLTVIPWPSLRLSVSPNENGVVNFEYSRKLSLPDTEMKVVFCLSSQNTIPVCALNVKRSFQAGFLDMKLFTKFEKEYSISAEFHGALNCGLCSDIVWHSNQPNVCAVGFRSPTWFGDLSILWDVLPKRFIAALEIPHFWKRRPYCLKVAHEEGKWVGTVASFVHAGTNTMRWAVSTAGDARLKLILQPSSEIRLAVTTGGSIVNLQLASLNLSFRLGR
jgi:hypothetical protein